MTTVGLPRVLIHARSTPRHSNAVPKRPDEAAAIIMTRSLAYHGSEPQKCSLR
jgi:hypothetical protein